MARHKTALWPDDRTWVEHAIDRLVDELDGRQNGHGLKELARDRLVADLRRQAENGDKQAERMLDALTLDGAWARIEARLAIGRCLIAWNGDLVSVPERIGVRRRDRDGLKAKHYQQPLWWECSWAEYMDWLATRRGQFNQQGKQLAVMEVIARLREIYPDTKTPGEACERAGLDPRDFGLDDVI